MDNPISECAKGNDIGEYGHTSETVAKIVMLSIIDLAVVFGNSLVIVSVITTRKLRTVTNIFIVSLACADLLLGFAVLPFSISLEVDEWLWGQIWCSMWLAIDVWLCTASILNLCAISFDRYIAVTHPIRYPTIMSPVRGRWLVACVWILSFIICLPPLLGWNDTGMPNKSSAFNAFQTDFPSTNHSGSSFPNITDFPSGTWQDLVYNHTADEYGFFSNNSASGRCESMAITCELTTTVGYRVYAANGSFFIPMLIMVFFYFRIYLTAVKTATAIRKGVLTTKTSNDMTKHNGNLEEEMQLRVHMGGGSSLRRKGSDKANGNHQPSNGSQSQPPKIRSQPSVRQSNGLAGSNGRSYLLNKEDSCHRNCKSAGYTNLFLPVARKICKANLNSKRLKQHECTEMEVLSGKKDTIAASSKRLKQHESTETEVLNGKKDAIASSNDFSCPNDTNVNGHTRLARSPRRCKLLIRESKAISVKGHARKFRREAKAAKTLAIIVGAFIICWCPFFTIYLVEAFCYDCVSELMFSVFFWLGYCNSALNPCIYALFSRDFRSAFKRLLMCQGRKKFTQAARADFVTGHRSRQNPIQQDKESESDY
ncbi:hypothetical protein DPMN_167778 [Dreissena polymorpha]|uniref:G-protein coupled receptors family 1 profile domain-containing protein n=2 Tax=Dreissena polymorpha TaxID=45954 RepID=A0A9D4F0V4_DREPO|nr:hypothetical protein DPMN_167778 [Dreissena polymorpha]